MSCWIFLKGILSYRKASFDCRSIPNLCPSPGLQLHCSFSALYSLKLRISGRRLRHWDLPGRGAQQGCHTASHLPTGVIIHSFAATRDTRHRTGQRPWQMAASLPSAGTELCLILGCMTYKKTLTILRLSCCVNSFTPCRMFILQKNGEWAFTSTAINANNKPYLHQSAFPKGKHSIKCY